MPAQATVEYGVVPMQLLQLLIPWALGSSSEGCTWQNLPLMAHFTVHDGIRSSVYVGRLWQGFVHDN
jgi:hypothetical protein